MRRLCIPLIVSLILAGCAHEVGIRGGPQLSPWAGGWQGEGHAARVSSWDQTGANSDNIRILPGQTATLADVTGPGVIRHIWTTTNAAGAFGRMLILRMYWDGSETPAVEVPYGDFFGVGNGMEAEVNSYPITAVSGGRSRNCWWPMPFENGFRITVTNEGPEPHGAFYFYVDYLALDGPPPTPMRFHAQYRQAYPADFPENYTILEANGSGQYMGVVMSVESTAPNWWGEGDDYIAVDDHEPLRGTGTEDYFCEAWGMREQATPWHGSPVCEGFDDAGLRTSMYRFHILDPIPFKRKIKVSIEHGTENDRADNLSSVAFWYQTPPAAAFPALPPVEDRLGGSDRVAFVQKKAWQIATGDSPVGKDRLARILSRPGSEENAALIKGLLAYTEGKVMLTEASLSAMDEHLEGLSRLVEAQAESERYRPPKIDLPTDDDSPVPGPAVAAQRMLERARHDLARRVARKRGFRPGDEIVVEVRDSLGNTTLPPAYLDSPDFTHSYAKVDDPHLMGSGARFTYGNADPSWARFTPDFPRSGRYEVFVIFSYGANAGDTRYEIRHAGPGKETAVMSLAQVGRPGDPYQNNVSI